VSTVLVPARVEAAVEVRPLSADVRVLGRSLVWLAAGAAVAVLVAVAWIVPFGGRALSVMSGSMSPAIETGDVVVSRGVSPLEIRRGDVITFRDPTDSERLITHRVKEIRISGGEARFVTKGDANNSAERWVVAADGEVGLVVYRLPKLGYALAGLGHPFAKLLLVALPAVLLGAYELRRIWTAEEGSSDAGSA
jgi:signal peptidase I